MCDQERSFEEAFEVKALVKATEILPDLNQINHIFIDKTGTLTKNKLIKNSTGATGPATLPKPEEPEVKILLS